VPVIFTASRGRSAPITAAPHPPIPFAMPMAALVLVFGLDLAWVANVRFPYAAAVVALAAIAGGTIYRWIDRKFALEPGAELFVLFPQWSAFAAILAATVLVNDLDRGASLGDLAANLALAVVLGGLLMGLPAAVAGLSLASRAVDGGPLPPRSPARRAVSLSVWRTAANCFALPNIFALLPAMGHAHTPWTSVGAMVAGACALLVTCVLVAQQVLFRAAREPEPAAQGAFGYREAPQRVEKVSDVTVDEKRRLARRELVRGVIALLLAAAVAAAHAFLFLL
jgi:hypothetical protein